MFSLFPRYLISSMLLFILKLIVKAFMHLLPKLMHGKNGLLEPNFALFVFDTDYQNVITSAFNSHVIKFIIGRFINSYD